MNVLTATHIQFLRYVTVGLASNVILFFCYLFLTHVGFGHKIAMTLLYILGVLQTFVANRSWSFEHAGFVGTAFTRYCSAYLLGYLLNLAALMLLVDWAGWPHEIVQGIMILVLAIMLFLLQKFWVFHALGTDDANSL